MQRHYPKSITINGRRFDTIVIDDHYEEKHAKVVTDELILALVEDLHGGDFVPEMKREGFEYFATEPHYHQEKPFRLIWALPLSRNYVGIVNCYRVKHGKKKHKVSE